MQTHARVLGSAERLFRENGYTATTIRQIAADANVSVGTVMAVGEKDALLVAIFDSWIRAVHELRAATGPTSEPGATDPVEQLVGTFGPFVEYFAGDKGLAREYAAVIVRGKQETAIFHELGASLIAEVREVLVASGVPRQRADAASDSIYLSYLGVLMIAANGALDVNQATDRLRTVITFALSTGEAH